MISIAAIISKPRRLSAPSTYTASLVARVQRFSLSSYRTEPFNGHGGDLKKGGQKDEVDGFIGDNKYQLRPQTVVPENSSDYHSVYKAIICGKVGEAPVQTIKRDGRKVTVFTVLTGGLFHQNLEKSLAQWHRIVVHDEEMGAYSVHNVVKNSSVYIEGSIETRVFHDTSNNQVKKIPEICVRADGKICLMNSREKVSNDSFGDLYHERLRRQQEADKAWIHAAYEAEWRRKELAKWMAWSDEIAIMQWRREWESQEKERLRREAFLVRASDSPSRPYEVPFDSSINSDATVEYAPRFLRYKAAGQVPPTPDTYYAHRQVKNSSVYGEGALETRGYNDSFSGQFKNIQEMRVPADVAERRRKEEAERMFRFDEIAKKQRQRDWEIEENERLRRDGLSRPFDAPFHPRPKPYALEEYAPRFQEYEGARQAPPRPERYYDHQRVNSSVYDEDVIETRGYYESFDGQFRNIQQIRVPADEAERLRKEEAERMAKFDEIAEKQRRRDWELKEREMLRREDPLWKSSDGLSRPSETPFRPCPTPDAPVEYAPRFQQYEGARPSETPFRPCPTPDAPVEYEPRFQRYEGARQAGPHPERHYDHQWVRSSSVYDENAIETKGYSDSFGQVQNNLQMRIPADEVERRRKVDAAERMARIEKQRQRDWELKEKERLGRSSDWLSRPSEAPFRPRPKRDAPTENAPRFQRSEGAGQAPPRPKYDQRVKSSSVSDEHSIETKGGNIDRFDRQARNFQEMRGPANEAEKRKKEDARIGRLDEMAEKHRRRGRESEERERQKRETSPNSHPKSGALVEYESRIQRREGASQPPRPEPYFDERVKKSSVDVNDRFDSQVKNAQEVLIPADGAGEIDEDDFQEWRRKRLLEEEKQGREGLAGESGGGDENPDSIEPQDTSNRAMGKNEAELTEQGRKVVQELLESGLRTQYLLEKAGEREKCELVAEARVSGDSSSEKCELEAEARASGDSSSEMLEPEALAGESAGGDENPDSSESQDPSNRVMGKKEAELTEQGRKIVQELLESGSRTQYLLEKAGEGEECELEDEARASGDSSSTAN